MKTDHHREERTQYFKAYDSTMSRSCARNGFIEEMIENRDDTAAHTAHAAYPPAISSAAIPPTLCARNGFIEETIENRDDNATSIPAPITLTTYPFASSAASHRILPENGGNYIGPISNGRANGFGVCSWDSGGWAGRYEGHFKDDTLDGRGKKEWNNGNIYEGEWRNGKKHGWGKFTWLGGDTYEGEFRDDLKHGQGKYTYANGCIFQGEYKDGKVYAGIETDRYGRVVLRSADTSDLPAAPAPTPVLEQMYCVRANNFYENMMETAPVSGHIQSIIHESMNLDENLEIGTDVYMVQPPTSYAYCSACGNSVFEGGCQFCIPGPELQTPAFEPVHVVLDCCNIGWNYGLSEKFSARGVQLAIEYFQQFSNTIVTAFILESYVRRKPTGVGGNVSMDTEDQSILEELYKTRQLTLVPAGLNDDIYIISYAHERLGFIITNDLFRDHINGVADPDTQYAMRSWFLTHRCGFLFVHDEFVPNPESALNGLLTIHDDQIDDFVGLKEGGAVLLEYDDYGEENIEEYPFQGGEDFGSRL